MNSMHSEFVRANNILNNFVKKSSKFENRFISLQEDMTSFIEANNLMDKVFIDSVILGYVLVDYFEDVRRLKEFHNVRHINAVRVTAYTAYWLLRRKPIQVKPGNEDRELVFINERFVLAYILSFLSNYDKGEFFSEDKSGLRSYADSLFYFLKYRFTSANALELAIMSFFSGQIYQEDSEDISEKLGKYEKSLYGNEEQIIEYE